MRFFWFVLLKVVEIGGVVFIPHYLGKLVHHWTEFFCFVDKNTSEISHIVDWMIGFGSLAITFIAGLVVALVIVLLALNWELAGKIRDKF